MKQHLEELRKKAEASWEGCDGCDEYDKNMWINGYITGTLANQVELPSDEEIEKEFTIIDTTYTHMIAGAKWMKEQIFKQIK